MSEIEYKIQAKAGTLSVVNIIPALAKKNNDIKDVNVLSYITDVVALKLFLYFALLNKNYKRRNIVNTKCIISYFRRQLLLYMT